MNLGLISALVLALPNILPVYEPVLKNLTVQNPYRIACFTSGVQSKGCFFVSIKKSFFTVSGYTIVLKFQIA